MKENQNDQDIISLRKMLMRQTLIVGVLMALNAFMFIGFSRSLFGDSQQPIMLLFLTLLGFMVANMSRKIRFLGKVRTAVEEKVHLQKECNFVTVVNKVLMALVPLWVLGILILKNRG